jgi:hypothetical protein
VKLLKPFYRISELGMSVIDKQRTISVSDVFHLWNHLQQRYYVMYLTKIFEIHARDEDLRLVLKYGKNTLGKHVDLLEKKLMEFAIPLPLRPPKQTQITESLEICSDRYIFRRVLRGIQSFLPTHTMAVIHSTCPLIRDLFLSFLTEEMKLYDEFMEYGKLKEYTLEPPIYKV